VGTGLLATDGVLTFTGGGLVVGVGLELAVPEGTLSFVDEEMVAPRRGVSPVTVGAWGAGVGAVVEA